MKKFILSAVAAGALAVGGAASAQDLGAVVSSLFGFGAPSYPTYSTSQPAVVAGTGYGQYGYYGNHNTYPGTSQVYVDQYGRQFSYDQYGRQVYVQPSTNYGIVGYDQWGRPVYGTTSTTTTYGTTQYPYGYSRPGDRDGDGVANINDRWPDDRRYW